MIFLIALRRLETLLILHHGCSFFRLPACMPKINSLQQRKQKATNSTVPDLIVRENYRICPMVMGSNHIQSTRKPTPNKERTRLRTTSLPTQIIFCFIQRRMTTITRCRWPVATTQRSELRFERAHIQVLFVQCPISKSWACITYVWMYHGNMKKL